MNNFYDKDEVIRNAEGFWVEIIQSLTSIDPKIFNRKKEHPCPICGGKTRFRYTGKTGAPFFCNVCGAKDGLNFYIAYTGCDFQTALTDVGNFLNMIPTEKREAINKQHIITSNLPDYYEYDTNQYEELKSMAEVKLSPWQRVNGLNMLNILAHGEGALIPLLDTNQNACDFVIIDVNNNWQTTGGNRCIPSGFYSTFGDRVGKRTYICVEPANSAHASVYMDCQVVCCYEPENILAVMGALDKKQRVDISTTEGRVKAIENMQREECDMDFAVIVSSMEDVEEADTLKLNQLTYNAQNRMVGRTVYKPFEIADKRKENGK
ncbi:DNA primase/helicase [Vibrio phage 1.197.A._10N.286.54.F2]|nr:DNA primase/helicase [Vibrio phage 1.197.A._10N.286.54.F2]